MNELRAMGMALVLAMMGCSKAEIGEACDTTGSQDECVEGAICDTDKNATIICLDVCESDSDCSTTHQCTGVSASNIKACHQK